MKFLALLLIAGLFSCASSQNKTGKVDSQVTWENSDKYSNPESMYYEPQTGLIFVSNVGGNPADKDGNGFISILSQEGKTINTKWVTGLNAPKGMRAHNGVLWVADIDQVITIDITNGRITKKMTVPGAQLLNDVTIAPDGTVYVSDTFGSAIYKIKNNKPTVFVKGEKLESPNGLLYFNNRLYVAAWGLTKDWSTETPGRLYWINTKNKEITFITQAPLGNLDGLEITPTGEFLVSDWVAGKVFKVSHLGDVTLIFTGDKGLADIGHVPGQNLVLAPNMISNKVMSFKY